MLRASTLLVIRREYTPRDYAPAAQQFMLDHSRCALFAGMGMGKSVMTLSALDIMYLTGMESRPTLVLGPKRVARDTWPEEALKWKHLRDVDIVHIGGTAAARRNAANMDAAIHTTNYEQIPWLLDRFGDKWPWGTVVADESTRLKNFRLKQGGKRAAALGRIAHTKVNRWINLTGTPAPNGLIDLWGQTWFLDMGQRLGRTYTAFLQRWFYSPPVSRKGSDGKQYMGKLVPHGHSEKEIHAALKDICMTLDPKDWFDLQDPVVTELRVKLPPKAMDVYNKFKKAMYAELECGGKVEVFNAAALTNKCLQLANGAAYHGDDGSWYSVHDAKLEALESVVSESGGMPVLVAYQFKSDKERIAKAFGAQVAFLDEPKGLQRFKAGGAAIGLAHPKSMGHGIDGLQDVTNILVRFGHGWALEERLQMLERIGPTRQMQSGLDRPVLVYDIIADQTIDEQVLERHESKREVQDLLLEAMKRDKPSLRFT